MTRRYDLPALTATIREGLALLRDRGVEINDAQIDERARNIAQAVLGWVYEQEGN